ncbi:hypothetical protein O1611_g3543 [Lasiodiplodia mahajangana]|uniref:Uncharacterized protein n=1 Tax=Lasiodiplodia mahajangana TaxID=1108764 RepID=A0ACC2JSB0_9PEZI|nr:hypothetical protein O1611_g3543 [Lasiodiplodia mahajangana]
MRVPSLVTRFLRREAGALRGQGGGYEDSDEDDEDDEDDGSISDNDESDYDESNDGDDEIYHQSDDDQDGEESENERLGELEEMLDVVRRVEAREDLTLKQRVKIQRIVLTCLTEWEKEDEGSDDGDDDSDSSGIDDKGEGEELVTLSPGSMAKGSAEGHEPCNQEQDKDPGNQNQETDEAKGEGIEGLECKGDKAAFANLKAQLIEKIEKAKEKKAVLRRAD